MIEKIKSILSENLPKKAFIYVAERPNVFSKNNYIAIFFGTAKDSVQSVSLSLTLNTLELEVQVFGGNGGQRVYVEPNKDEPKQKYLIMHGEKVPFRKPATNETAVLKAIEMFARRWTETLKVNRDILIDKNKFDYDDFFNS